MNREESATAGAVVVITGASSGIGRAAAHAFAKEGARLVLAARSTETLHEVAKECAAHGAQAVIVSTDISDESQVEALMHSTIEAFGRIDMCVANASVYSYGTFETTPPDVFRRIVETNLLGPIHTARAVLPHFRSQGQGTLIIIGSVYSKITSPYVSPYVTSKFGCSVSPKCCGRSYDRPGTFTSASYYRQQSTPPSTSTPGTTPAGRSTHYLPSFPPTVSPGRYCEIRNDHGR